MMKYKYNTSFSYKGKKFNVVGNSQKEVAEKRLAKIQEIDQSLKKESKVTIAEWTYKCIDLYKTGQAEITRKKYINRVRHCILENIGHLQVKDVKPFQLQEVLNLQKGKSKAQINEVYNALRFIFGKAYANDIISKDPSLSLVKPKGNYNPRRSITDFERDIFVKVASRERKYYGYLLMLFCGCRPSEAFNCKGEDIKEIDGVTVLHIKGSKTALSNRVVPIPMYLSKIIKNTRKSQNIALTSAGKPIGEDNRARLWRGLWYKMNIEAGTKTYRNALIEPYMIPKDFTPYCLRHSYCSDLAKKNIDIRIAQRLMGHSTISLTANIYTHVETADIISSIAGKL